MATRTIYATIRIDLNNDEVDEITDEMVEEFVEDCEYSFDSTSEVEVYDTSWCGTEY